MKYSPMVLLREHLGATSSTLSTNMRRVGGQKGSALTYQNSLSSTPPPIAMQEYEADLYEDEDDAEASAKCKRCALGDFLPLVVLTLLVIGFCLLGGIIFMNLENDCAKHNHVDASICDQAGNNWTISEGVQYSVILVTTIGWGDLAPKSSNGKLVTIFYGAVGIPLFFAAYVKIGKILAHLVLCIYTQILTCGVCRRRNDDDDEENEMNGLNTIASRTSIYSRQISKVEVKKAERGRFGAVVIGILIFIGYIVGTTFLIRDKFVFKNQEKVDFVEALYFNFGTLSLTGYGELYPNVNGIFQLEDTALFWQSFIFYVYLANGISLLFMNIFLIRLEVNRIWFITKSKLGIV